MTKAKGFASFARGKLHPGPDKPPPTRDDVTEANDMTLMTLNGRQYDEMTLDEILTLAASWMRTCVDALDRNETSKPPEYWHGFADCLGRFIEVLTKATKS